LQYLDYENKRASYLEEVWKVVNWKDVESRFKDAK
jgi:Fe-Mn family superoxide dismutase